MTLTSISSDHPVFMPSISAARFGTDNWGKVKGVDHVLEGPPIGHAEPFRETTLFQSFRMVFEEGRPWTETEFYRSGAERIAAGKVLWKCTSPEEFLHRLETDIRRLHASMKRHGFLKQRDIARLARSEGEGEAQSLVGPFLREGYSSSVKPTHEIKLGINEAGQFLFLDGRHRLSIALILGIAEIPVRIVFRHAQWAALRERVAQHALLQDSTGEAFVSMHPDLREWRLSGRDVIALGAAFQASGVPQPAYRFVSATATVAGSAVA